jgi:gluconolactonase
MAEVTEITSGLRFPEGPIAMPDGSIVVVEIFGPRLTRVQPDGTKETIAEIPGGPNGAAVGPDGAFYICNNGGCFTPFEFEGLLLPGPFDPDRYIGGRIQRVDPSTGEVTDLYTEVDGNPLRAPNDVVFDHHGGMWFTDHGIRHGRNSDITGIYYARPDGSLVKEVVFPTEAPNGIGLAPDDSVVYWAETHTGRVLRRTITGPGEVEAFAPFDFAGPCLAGLPGMQLLDSMAVDGDGNVCVATLINGGVTVISPKGEVIDFVATGDIMTTNVCFGGPDLRTAYITLSGTGRLVSTPSPRAGLKLAY